MTIEEKQPPPLPPQQPQPYFYGQNPQYYQPNVAYAPAYGGAGAGAGAGAQASFQSNAAAAGMYVAQPQPPIMGPPSAVPGETIAYIPVQPQQYGNSSNINNNNYARAPVSAQPLPPQQALFSNSVNVVHPQLTSAISSNPDWPFRRRNGKLYYRGTGAGMGLNFASAFILLICTILTIVFLSVGLSTRTYMIFVGFASVGVMLFTVLMLQCMAQGMPSATITLDDDLRQITVRQFGAILLLLYWILRRSICVQYSDIADVIVEQTPNVRINRQSTGKIVLVTRSQGNIAISGPQILSTAEAIALGIKRTLAAKVANASHF